MRKIIWPAVFILISIFLSSRSASCEEIKNKVAVGLGASYVVPEDAEFEDTPTVLGKATLGYGITDYLAAELEWDTFRLESNTGSRVRLNSVFINGELRLNRFGKFVPYAIGGIGASFLSFDNLSSEDKKGKAKSFAYKLGAGAEYFLTSRWAVNSEVVHFYADTGEKTNLDVYSWQYSVGVKYYF